MNAIEHIVHNLQEIIERFKGKDCDNLAHRKLVYKELVKSNSPLVEYVSSSTFNTVVHTVLATAKALEAKANVMPSVIDVMSIAVDNVMPEVINVMPVIETNVMPEVINDGVNISISKKDVDIITGITDNSVMQDKEKQLTMFELTIEDRLTALEKSIAELTSNRPQSTLNRVKIKPVRDADVPGNYKGYTVNFGNGNYRLIKRVKGKLHCIHVGKEWNADKADAALLRWEAKKNNQPTMPTIQSSINQ